MNKLLSLWQKELRSIFNSPIAVGAIIFFLLFVGIWFLWINQFLAQNTASMRPYFSQFPLAFAILVPAITMRSWAEERKMGSQDLLLTLPVKTGHLVLGKFLGAWSLVLCMIVLTIPMVLMVSGLGQFEPGEIWGEYIGILLLSGAATALGVFISSLATNTISAFLLTLALLLIFTLSSLIAGTLQLPEGVTDIIHFFGLDSRYSNFEKGILDTKDVFYYFWFAALFLYLNTKTLILRKWR